MFVGWGQTGLVRSMKYVQQRRYTREMKPKQQIIQRCTGMVEN